MTPPCHTFPASELPLKAQLDVHGRRRKPDANAATPSRKIDLSACELLQMLQYKCEVQRPALRESPVQCYAVDRLFRRCKDKKGSFLVETTAWEGTTSSDESSAPTRDNDGATSSSITNKSKSGNESEAAAPKPYQWSSNWHDSDIPSR